MRSLPGFATHRVASAKPSIRLQPSPPVRALDLSKSLHERVRTSEPDPHSPTPSPHLREYLLSSTLTDIKFPKNPQRSFAYSQPVNFKKHFSIPASLRIPGVTLEDICKRLQGANVLIRSQRGFGKTSFAFEFTDYLNLEDSNAALYINLGGNSEAGDDVPHAIHLIYDEINNRAKDVLGIHVPFSRDRISGATHHLEDLLRTLQIKLDERGLDFHLVVDDAQNTNPESIGELIRLVNLEEGGERIGPQTLTITSSKDMSESVVFSPESRRYEESMELQNLHGIELPAFTFNHLKALGTAYQQAVGKVIEEPALNRIMLISDGHPWIINRVLSQLTKSRTFQDVTVFDVDQVVVAAEEVEKEEEPIEYMKLMRESRSLKNTSS